jgi:hypothetical protein
MPERFQAKTKNRVKKLTERPNVFTITGKNSPKTTEAVYHNVKNIILKLASYGYVSEKMKFAGFPKRTEAKTRLATPRFSRPVAIGTQNDKEGNGVGY